MLIIFKKGFELTFRLSKLPSEYHLKAVHAPEWPIHFLQSLARYVYRTSNVFGSGDHMPFSKPLGGDDSSQITALLFTNDTGK
jgi:suppressor of fused-like protein